MAQRPVPPTFTNSGSVAPVDTSPSTLAVARSVSNTSGGTLTTTRASKTANVTYSIRKVPEYYEPDATSGAGINWPRSSV